MYYHTLLFPLAELLLSNLCTVLEVTRYGTFFSFPRNLLIVLPTAYTDKLNLISVLDFYYFVLEILPEDGTLVLKRVRSLILVMNRIFLSAFAGWCTGCKEMQLYD